MKKIFIKILAIIAIIIIIISPYFLIINFAKYSPFILSVWLICAAYFVFVKSRNERDLTNNKKNDE